MMNQPCPMIQDLLPLYVDQICSQESRRAVEEHVENCPLCRARLEELRREDPLPPPEQDREQSKARVLAGVKRQLRRKKLCFSARVLAGAAALGVAVWLLVFRFQTPIPYSQDIRIQEVEPAFHMKYLGRDYAGLEVLFRVTEEGGETIRRVYLCYTGSLWTRYLSPGSPYHESVGINNGIVLVDYINQLRLEGMGRREAIIEAGVTRLRPILMTSLTTILGLIVMAFGNNVGTALMQPVALVCIGGLLYATLMTLLVVPCMYDILSRRDLRRRVGGNDPGPGYSRCQRAEAAARQPVERPRVVYQGVAGAYSEMASLRFFGEDCRCQGLPTFEEVFQTVAQGGADYGVVPIENSSTGAIRQVYELLGRYECYIVGENTVKVEHCLMAPHGATLDTITHVYSHEQGLFQCEPFLARHPGWVGVAHGDTAGSAQYVAQTGDITKAAICSSRAAELYGLEILARGVNYNSNNTTRFVVVSPVMELREGADKISAVLSLPDEVGSLHEVLTIFAVHGLNLVKLESRPLPGRSWEYLFFLEFDGSLADPAMDGALQELSQASAEMRVLGNFKSNL